MRQPPRQPPRQAPKAARSGGGARKPPAQRNKAPVRKPPQQQGGPGAKGGKVPPMTEAQRKSMQHQRNVTYWALHGEEKESLYNQQHAAGGEAIGTVLNADRRARWKTSYAIGAIAALILAGFTGAMAFGAESLAIGMIAFMFLAISVGFVTAEFSQRHFPQPVQRAPIGQHRLEDLIFEDDPTPRPQPPVDKTEVNSMNDLHKAFSHTDQKPTPAPTPVAHSAPSSAEKSTAPEAAAAPSPAPPSPEAETSADSEVEVLEGDVIRVEPDASAPAEPSSSPAPPAPASEPTPEESPTVAEPPSEEPPASADNEPAEAASAATPAPADTSSDRKEKATFDFQPLVTDPPLPAPEETPPGPAMPAGAAQLGITDVRDVAATLVVGNLDRSVEFYTQNLRLIVVDRTSEAALLEAGFGRILLWQRDDAPAEAQGIMHLTFEVGNLEATYRTMRSNGVNFSGEPTDALEGENFQLRAAAFSDPDGHGLAITERQDPAEG